MSDTQEKGLDRSVFSIIAWAIFLGMSWTWCIGMFLPVLLVRDYGIWGFVVFAVPNVIGAAAMAWVLPDAEASRAFVEKHGAACRWFSFVTVVFHIYFLAWIASWLVGPFTVVRPLLRRERPPNGAELECFLGLFAVHLILLYGLAHRRRDWIVALSTLALSVAAATALWQGNWIPAVPTTPRAGLDVLYLAPVCFSGFLLCPYLDLTFHRARQHLTPSAGRAAFAMGFGGFFLLMILFSLAYIGLLVNAPCGLDVTIRFLLGLHLVGQSCLKLALHGSEVLRPLSKLKRITVLFALGTIAVLMLVLLRNGGAICSLPAGETGYRCFMGAYGLLFPAYVWIYGFGRRPRSYKPLAVVVLLAMPMFWLGFVLGQPVWLIPGLAVVLLSKLAFIPMRQAA